MEGNSGLDFLTEIPQEDVELTQITTAEAVEHYLAQHDPLRSRVDDRWLERRGGVQEPYLTGPYLLFARPQRVTCWFSSPLRSVRWMG